MMHTKFHGLYGMKGNRYGAVAWEFYISGWNKGVDFLQQVDVVGGNKINKLRSLSKVFG
jgi:hypothetical protein